MARVVVVSFVDDLDGKQAADETVTFALDGIEYTIDLSADNADALRRELAPWISHARKIRGARGKSTPARQRPAEERQHSTAIREWARSQGLPVSSRGRIPAELVAAYHAAMN